MMQWLFWALIVISLNCSLLVVYGLFTDDRNGR